jgi:hypothetical protein
MWHLISVNFTVTALALLWYGIEGQPSVLGWFASVQFAGYATVYLVIGLRLGRPLELLQWAPFAATAVLAGAGALVQS